MSRRGRALALVAWAAWSVPIAAQEPPPDGAPPADDAAAPSEAPAPNETAPNEEPGPSDAPAPSDAVTPDEQRALEEALAADAAGADANAGTSTGVPDLSQVNVGKVLPAAVQSLNPDIAFILDVAGAWFSVDEPLQTGGHDPRRTGFTLQQLELSLGASVDPFLRFDSNIVFTLTGVEIEEAYATTLALPFNLQMRAGQFLSRFGRVNTTHPHTWHFIDQPIVLGKFFGGEGNHGLGAELSWLAPLPWYLEVSGAVTNADGACCARSYYGADEVFVRTPLDTLETASVRQFFPLGDDLSLMWGLSAQTGPNATGPLNRTEIYATDLMLRYRPSVSETRWSLTWQTEAMVRGRQVPFGKLVDGGGYSQLVWNIDPRWETGARYEMVTGVPGDPLDPEWESARHRGALQGTFYPSHFSRVRLQGAVDWPTWRAALPDGLIWAVMLNFEILVGAHGAHGY